MSNVEIMLEKALRGKYRFAYKGSLSVEELYTLNVEELDKIYQTLMAKKKEAEGVSLLSSKTAENEELDTKIEIVKHIVELKLTEAEARKQEKERAAKKQEILAILADKESEALKGKSEAELRAMLESL